MEKFSKELISKWIEARYHEIEGEDFPYNVTQAKLELLDYLQQWIDDDTY